jgi:DNA-binding response OmpR family regulator
MKLTNKPADKILVVDDDPDISMMLKLMLEYKGYSVTILEKPEETIKMLEEGNFSMVIIDMLLSGISGTDICTEIRQNKKVAGFAILMISAHPNARQICLQAGADDFIAKPFDMKDILSMISRLLIKKSKQNPD